MKKINFSIFFVVVTLFITGGIAKADEYDKYIKPVTNPVYFDEPYSRSYVHVAQIYQTLPSHVNTILGNVPLDGDLFVTALRINYAINECFSLVAAKDGYVDFNPEDSLDDESGWANIIVGVKGLFIRESDKEIFVSGSLLFELPTGQDDVFQGDGEGSLAPTVNFLKGYKGFQFSGVVGGKIPFNNNDESTMFFDSWHVSYGFLNCTLFPLVELNHFHVLNEGENDDLVPSIVRFEGGDFLNLGASHAEDHRDFVTLAAGFRYKVTPPMELGLAYETPLTAKENGLMSSRITFDLVYHF